MKNYIYLSLLMFTIIVISSINCFSAGDHDGNPTISMVSSGLFVYDDGNENCPIVTPPLDADGKPNFYINYKVGDWRKDKVLMQMKMSNAPFKKIRMDVKTTLTEKLKEEVHFNTEMKLESDDGHIDIVNAKTIADVRTGMTKIVQDNNATSTQVIAKKCSLRGSSEGLVTIKGEQVKTIIDDMKISMDMEITLNNQTSQKYTIIGDYKTWKPQTSRLPLWIQEVKEYMHLEYFPLLRYKANSIPEVTIMSMEVVDFGSANGN